jgi:hypothetical protein
MGSPAFREVRGRDHMPLLEVALHSFGHQQIRSRVTSGSKENEPMLLAGEGRCRNWERGRQENLRKTNAFYHGGHSVSRRRKNGLNP